MSAAVFNDTTVTQKGVLQGVVGVVGVMEPTGQGGGKYLRIE